MSVSSQGVPKSFWKAGEPVQRNVALHDKVAIHARERKILLTGLPHNPMLEPSTVQCVKDLPCGTQPQCSRVNELVTNAAKHGRGKISVSYRRAVSDQMLSVCDEGDGLPLGFDPTAIDGSLACG